MLTVKVNKLSDFSKQCKYLQLEKPSSIDFETPIQKRLANNILKGWAKRTRLGLIGLTCLINNFKLQTAQHQTYIQSHRFSNFWLKPLSFTLVCEINMPAGINVPAENFYKNNKRAPWKI